MITNDYIITRGGGSGAKMITNDYKRGWGCPDLQNVDYVIYESSLTPSTKQHKGESLVPIHIDVIHCETLEK